MLDSFTKNILNKAQTGASVVNSAIFLHSFIM